MPALADERAHAEPLDDHSWHSDRAGQQGILELVEVQLRDYRIQPGQMDAWIAGWKSGVVPVRQEFGFQVLGAWVDREHDRFIWLIGYPGADGFDAANDRYYASEQRSSLRPEPSELIEEAKKVMVDPVL
jgi:hypothetical protein